ncbi:MAG: DUF1189 family protein [Candidatus Omnitrophica bacterium]|nr:DUF1189 family protein [Candidatus Omnitrophota bacterium]
MDILLGPVFSFFSVSFYRRIIHSRLGKGFLYLAYLAFLYGLILLVTLWLPFKPALDRFEGWFTTNLPQMTFTREGVVTKAAQPFEMKSSEYGSVLILDATKNEIGDIPDTWLYITKTKALFRGGNANDFRVVELVPKNEEEKTKWKDVTLTGDSVHAMYKRVMPFAHPVIFIVVFFTFFLWKILAALVYSLVALLLNLFRREKLQYGSLLALSMFALTPVTVLQVFSLFIPRVGLALNPLTAFILTGLYLALGILATQNRSGEVPAQ